MELDSHSWRMKRQLRRRNLIWDILQTGSSHHHSHLNLLLPLLRHLFLSPISLDESQTNLVPGQGSFFSTFRLKSRLSERQLCTSSLKTSDEHIHNSHPSQNRVHGSDATSRWLKPEWNNPFTTFLVMTSLGEATKNNLVSGKRNNIDVYFAC